MEASLNVVMYHYVRDLPNTPFPKIKGMLTREFCEQLTVLQNRYEMTTLECALDFLRGNYTPARDLCLLTFDDGLKEHYSEVTPLLLNRGIQGVFFVITSCISGDHIAPVHMNHLLMAAVDFADYRRAFLEKLTAMFPDSRQSTTVDTSLARQVYRWDDPDVAGFKYLFNFLLDYNQRDQILEQLFREKIGDISSFARDLYLNEREAREMQSAGMMLGGHSHQHKPLSSLSEEELQMDLKLCDQLLKERLRSQPFWPFCYPYGKQDSFSNAVSDQLKSLGFNCAFSTEVGSNTPGSNTYALRRLDCKDISV